MVVGVVDVLGRVHYRFDVDLGLTLGRTVAHHAADQDVNGHLPFELQ